MASHISEARRPATAVALALALTALGACQSDRVATGSLSAPADFRERHPIVVGDAPRVLDLFVEGQTGLTGRSRQDLAAFTAEQRRYSNSLIVVQVPVGTENGYGTRLAMNTIREATRGQARFERYHPADPTIGSPIRLSFQRLQAKVAAACGTWPEDLGVGDAAFHASNRTWHNYGCALQSNFASQVADPNDLVRPRQETAPDTQRRSFNIDQLRKAIDPATQWRVGSGVGNAVSPGQ